MKSKFLSPVILIAGLMLVNFSVYQVYGQTPQDKPVKQRTVMYTCPMHPEVVRDQPGNCPKCGMKLVEKKDRPKGEMQHAHDSTCMKHDAMNMKYDSTCMKHDAMKMKHDSTCMKHDAMKMKHDSTCTEHDAMKMKHDPTIMRKNNMLQDSTSMQTTPMKMKQD